LFKKNSFLSFFHGLEGKIIIGIENKKYKNSTANTIYSTRNTIQQVHVLFNFFRIFGNIKLHHNTIYNTFIHSYFYQSYKVMIIRIAPTAKLKELIGTRASPGQCTRPVGVPLTRSGSVAESVTP
jgi:hypothetical protein